MANDSNLISLFTDAGLKSDVASWAMWAKWNGETIRYSGMIKRICLNSADAELCAIANGLLVIQKRWDPPENTRILLQTDSTNAIENIARGINHDVVTYINSLVIKQQWTFLTRHVKGHRGNMSPRHAVNTWCDMECTRLLKTHLRTIKKVENPETTKVIETTNVIAFTHHGPVKQEVMRRRKL